LLLSLHNISNTLYVGIRHDVQHDSDLIGISSGLQRLVIMYTYNIVSTLLLRTQLI